MSFYDELSKVYSIVFPIDEATLSFLSKGTTVGDHVLDVACGTGDFSLELARRGHNVDGIDLSNDMIEIAKSKAEGRTANFIAGDMTKIKEIFNPKRYDMIFCIGNSIVHLNDKKTISMFISECYDMLKSDSKLVIQTVNYDRIIENSVISLPLIDISDKGVRFERKYNYRKDEGIVDFITELNIVSNGAEQKYSNSIPLIPLLHDELLKMINSAGFKKTEVYGSFKEDPYVMNESYALVIRAEK